MAAPLIADLLRTSHKAKRFGFAVFLIGLALCGVGLWLLLIPAKYQATTRIAVEHDYVPGVYDPYYIQTEFEVIQSELLLGRVIEALNLNAAWGEKYAGGGTLETSERLRLLRKRLKLRLVKNTKFIDIGVTDANPVEAARIANRIAETFRNFKVEQRQQYFLGSIRGLDDDSRQKDQQIKDTQEKLTRLRADLKLPMPEPAEDLLKAIYPSYFQAKTELEAVEKSRTILTSKIESEKSQYANRVKTPLVEIVQLAVPPKSPMGHDRLFGIVLLFCGLGALAEGFYLITTAAQ